MESSYHHPPHPHPHAHQPSEAIRQVNDRGPPAGLIFDPLPSAPPRTETHRSTLYTSALTHARALRRASVDPHLARRAIPAAWLAEDNPNDTSTLRVCGTTLIIPVPFDDHCVLTAFERELDRKESKFRAGRKDKSIGGELGSIIVKKKPVKQTNNVRGKGPSHPSRPPSLAPAVASPSLSALHGQPGPSGPHSQDNVGMVMGSGSSTMGYDGAMNMGHMANGSLVAPGAKRSAQSAFQYPGNEKPSKRPRESMERPQKNIDHTAVYRNAVKSSDIPKMVKHRSNFIVAQMRLSKSIAAACVRESRKSAFRSVRVIDEAHRRARRILRDVLAYWKKEDKERQEERKKLMARADEHRKQEAEEREAQRQKNKLKFLLGQSEAFSTFLKAKTKATADADDKERAKENNEAKGKEDEKPAKVGDINAITGAEDDAELKKIAAAKAAQLVEEHQARIRQFDTDTQMKKTVANKASEKAAADLAAAKKAMNVKKLTEAEREALETHDVEKEQNQKQTPPRPAPNALEEARLAGGEKPEVAAVRQPTILNCKMKDYQLRGLAWLVSLYDQGINGILADEMGLGKTLQTISFLAYLCEEEDNWGPFLVVSPKATLHNWQQEVTKFCPALKVLPYWGNKNERNELRKYWSHKRMYRRDSEFQVCVTSYETLTVDEKYFSRVKWQYLVLDEAQAIKNSNSTRWRALLQFPCRNRLLLTGTPLQNKLSELWSLLHFIMPTIFDSHAEFADWFAKDIEGHAQNNKILDASTLARLRTLLDPFMLRRVKRDVESEMPPKTEVQLPCTLSARQRQLYASIKANISPEELVRALGGDAQQDNSDRNSKLMNLVMQLRKVCNHPETFERRVPQSPFQFQVEPPLSHVAPPPTVLAGNESTAPLDITIICRSEVVHTVPRQLEEVALHLRGLITLIRRRFGLWSRSRLMKCVENRRGSFASIARLSGGFSASEINTVMEQGVDLWDWEKFWLKIDGLLFDMETTTFFGSADDREQPEYDSPEVFDRPFRMLVHPRAIDLRRQRSCVLLPRLNCTEELVARETRLLRSARVYIPKAVAPSPRLYIPGDAQQARIFTSTSNLAYDGIPVRGESHGADQVYKAHRRLDADYGTHVGTAPIQMPEAGRLIADCGKMMVLDPLLRRLKTEGHKCLIYSQFTRVLDILEDYCGKTSFKYVRLDGQSALADRRDIVAEWQANEELFIFLLSTRAGGVGLNLTAADTVIFFDSDWNPTQDLQAMDRAHRLGQERPVTVYRLISRGTIEERMLIRAQQKNKINDLVIKGGGLNTEVEDNNTNDAAEIDDIAALLMGEEEFGAYIDAKEAFENARQAVALLEKTI